MDNYYELFGLSNNATNDELRVAYKQLAKKYHPDNNPGNSVAAKKFRLITEGFGILLDPVKRKEYDIQLRQYVLSNWQKRPEESKAGQGAGFTSQQQAHQYSQPRTGQQQTTSQQSQPRTGQQQTYQQTQQRTGQQANGQQANGQQANGQQASQQANRQAYQYSQPRTGQQQAAQQQYSRPGNKKAEKKWYNKLFKIALISLVCLIVLLIGGYFLIDSLITAKHKVTFNICYESPQYQNGVYATRKVKKDNIIDDVPTAPQRDGYIFTNWYKEQAYSNIWRFDEDKVTSDITLYAQWLEDAPNSFERYITYNTGGGTCEESGKTVSYKESFVLEVPMRTGYNFTGWYSESGGNGVKYTNQNGESIEVFSGITDITLYAGWEGKAYTVTYSYESATGNNTAQTEEVVFGEDYTLVVPVKSGYGFAGWFSSAAGGKQYTDSDGVSNSAWSLDDGVTLYAQWLAIFTTSGSYINGLTAYGKTLESITIPSAIGEIACTNIGSSAFNREASLKEVIISEGITKIWGYAFSECTNLERVVLPQSLTSLDSAVFNKCSSLNEINIPSQITALSERLFAYCTALTSINIPATVEGIGSYAFHDSGLSGALTVASNITSIGNRAFERTNITSADLRAVTSMTALPEYIFSECTLLTTVQLPSSLLSIESNAFYKTGLTEITIPAQVTHIKTSAFQSSAQLETVNLNVSGVTDILDYAFNGCTVLANINLPSTLKTIGNRAFYSTNALTSVQLTSVETIGEYAFYQSGLINVTLPNTLTSIGRSAFYYCASLTTVVLSSNVAFNTIPRSAFEYCTSLNIIVIPSNITTIEQDAFYGCRAITSIIIPSSVVTVGVSAFGYWQNTQTIYIRHASRPEGWNPSWYSSAVLSWGYAG